MLSVVGGCVSLGDVSRGLVYIIFLSASLSCTFNSEEKENQRSKDAKNTLDEEERNKEVESMLTGEMREVRQHCGGLFPGGLG